MINWFRNTKRTQLDTILTQKVDEMKAYTQPLADGRTGLFTTNGTLVSSFARPRDAKRGAERRGLVIIN